MISESLVKRINVAAIRTIGVHVTAVTSRRLSDCFSLFFSSFLSTFCQTDLSLSRICSICFHRRLVSVTGD